MPCRPTWNNRLPTFKISSYLSWPKLRHIPISIMSAVVETSSPHLRVSAAKASDKTQPESTRIQAPEALVDDHFFWTYTEEPHRSRRQAIIKAHPEVRNPVLRTLMAVWRRLHAEVCGAPTYTWPLCWARDGHNKCNCNADS